MNENCIRQEHKREANILFKASDHIITEIAFKHGAFIAGGSVRSVFASEKINDFDIFFPTKEAFEACIDEINQETDSEGGFKYNFTTTASAWSYFTDKKQHFQLICAAYGDPETIISKFDFTVCMGVWFPHSSTFLLNEYFLKHIAQKRLCFNINADYPICSLWRVMKYSKKGYKLPAVDAIKLALRIHSIKMDTHEDFKKQLMGIDTVFLSTLVDRLGELTPDAKYDFGEAIEMISTFIDEKESLEE